MEKPIGPLYCDYSAKQTILIPKLSMVESLYVRFGTFCRINRSNISVKVLEKNKVLGEWIIDAADLIDNAYRKFKFKDEIKIENNDVSWDVIISCDAKDLANGVALFFEDDSKTSFLLGRNTILGELSLNFKLKRDFSSDIDYKHVGSIGLISVVIPSYNCSGYLENCIKSVINQTYNNIEIIVVDDGSEKEDVKKSKEIVSKLNNIYNHNIKIIECGENSGAAMARNVGSTLANGEFLFFLDSDTYLRSDAFELMINALHSHPECSYSYCQFKWGDRIIYSGPFKEEGLKRYNYVSMMSLLRRCDFPDTGLDDSLKRYQDWDLWLQLLKENKIGVWVDQVLFESEKRENSISNGGSITDKEAREVLRKKHSWANIPIF